MNEFARTVEVTVELFAEAVEQEWAHRERWIEQSAIGRAELTSCGAWLDAYEGESFWERRFELGMQLREELHCVLTAIRPELATALLCGIGGAKRRGYTEERLAASLEVPIEQIGAWRREAYAQIETALSEHTPLLSFLRERVAEDSGGRQRGEAQAVCSLLQQAGQKPSFDLRQFVDARSELKIRQALHRAGLDAWEQVAATLPEQAEETVQLVRERMRLELGAGEVPTRG